MILNGLPWKRTEIILLFLRLHPSYCISDSCINYDYTVEVRNSFKGLDLIDRVPDELWTEVLDIV